MNTYRITEKDIEGMKPVATGYKIFKNDWTSKYGNYDYKDDNGNVLGTIHKCDDELLKCKKGLHFSVKPHNCFNFYESVQWNKFAKVEAYDKLIDCGDKSITNILKIVEVYSFDKFVKIIQDYLQSDNGGNDINVGSNSVWGALSCEGISRSIFVYNKSGELYLFNRKTTVSRFDEVYSELLDFGWYPKFNNAEELKGHLEWYETNIPAIVRVPNEVAWSYMPKDMKDYIFSLPEFDQKVFDKVTGKVESR